MIERNVAVPSDCTTTDAVARHDEQLLDMPNSGQGVLARFRLIRNSGQAAQFAIDEFFHADVRNPHTRRAYLHAVNRFLDYVQSEVESLAMVTPAHVGRYFDQLPVSAATRKLHLSALRHFFDRMVNRHVVVLNPALSVRGDRTTTAEGKTAEIPPAEVRHLLKSIDTSHIVGLRDRLAISLLAFTAARVGAIVKLRICDVRMTASESALQMEEKRGKSRNIPIRSELAEHLREYLAALGNFQPGCPLLLTAIGKTRRLTDSAMSAADIRCMLKRRLKSAGLSTHYSQHSFRVMAVTDLLNQGVSLEAVQFLAGHSDPRTTRLYDRRQQKVTRNLVERISV